MAKIVEKINEFFINTGHSIKYMFVDKPENEEEIVSFSGKQKITNLTKEQVSHYSNVLHKNDAKAAEKISNSLCYVVIGAILLVVGFIFIFLSLQKYLNRIRGINFASIPFVLCVVCLVLGCAILLLGVYKVITAHNRRKQYQHYINLLAKRDKELRGLEK